MDKRKNEKRSFQATDGPANEWDMSNAQSSPESRNAHTPDVEESSRVGKSLKWAGKAAVKTAAFDVLWKDAKRIKPRFPHLWRDIAKFRPGMVKNEPTGRTELRKTKITALIITLMTLFICAYFALLVMATGEVQRLNMYSVGVTGLVAMAGVVQSICYWWVYRIQKKKAIETRNRARPTPRQHQQKQQQVGAR